MFSKILVAFDGNNLNVIRALAKVSRSPDVKIYMVSVVKIGLFGKLMSALFSFASKEWRPANYAVIEKSTESVMQDLAVYSDKVVCYIRVGDPYLSIKRVIKDVQPDLIIMGGSLPTQELTMFSAPTPLRKRKRCLTIFTERAM